MLAPYELILGAWAAWPSDGSPPLERTAPDCQARWREGRPLLADWAPALSLADLEPVMASGLDALALVGADPDGLRRFAVLWDAGEIRPSDLLPGPGRLADTSLAERAGVAPDCVGFLASAALRPALDRYFASCRAQLPPDLWQLGVCPFCGAPPAFADLLEDGRRQLVCHVCDGRWAFGRLTCPYCGSQKASDMARLVPEAREEGYALSVCKACGGYVKELDRRLRWNAGPALVEDWGTPHLDLVARRSGYWRAVPILMQPDVSI